MTAHRTVCQLTGEHRPPTVFFAALAAADARLAAADGDRAAARPAPVDRPGPGAGRPHVESTAWLLHRAAHLLRDHPDAELVAALRDRAAQFEAIDD